LVLLEPAGARLWGRHLSAAPEWNKTMMVGRSDFDSAEWRLLRQAPAYAGLIVAAAQRNGSFWEVLSIAQTSAEVRARHDENRLLDDIVTAQPLVERTRFHSADKLRAHGLAHIRGAMELLTEKAQPPTSTPSPVSRSTLPRRSHRPIRTPSSGSRKLR